MPPTQRIPPLLQSYIHPLQDSFTLLTGVLGAGTNWLVVRYITAALGDDNKSHGRRLNQDVVGQGQRAVGDGDEGEKTAVILVSYLRDYEFWKSECRRGGALDLPRLSQQSRFAFIDGLSHLFVPYSSPTPPSASLPGSGVPGALPSHPTPFRNPPRANLGTPTLRSPAPSPSTSQSSPDPQYLHNPSLTVLSQQISQTIAALNKTGPRRILLILDGSDLLLATSAPDTKDAIKPSSLISALLSLRSSVNSTLVTLSADFPLVSASTSALNNEDGHREQAPHSGLEVSGAAFLTSLAHAADTVCSLRLLETGVAGDVSGVMRVARREDEDKDEDEDVDRDGEEVKEMLYKVQVDGGVRVFERGAEGG